MNCSEANDLIQGYLDNELDLVRAIDIERHMEVCAACSQTYRQYKALRHVLKEQGQYYMAPADLQSRIRSAVVDLPSARGGAPSRRRQPITWLNFGPSLAMAVVATLSVSLYLAAPSQSDLLTEDIISSHVRSLMASHLADVASSDQHTVKPWFTGRLDFSPPVMDWAAQGFPLVGGRLDYLDNRPVAALVYRHRQHLINLFIWPATSAEVSAPHTLSKQGYNLVHWTQGGMVFWAISDLNLTGLKNFVFNLAAPSESGGSG
jgi:anti-sigma factor RsiW